LSGPDWRFTDDQGSEHTVSTEELRTRLASGKLAPSTPVFREGMKEPAPAFTVPELSSAAIAAARSTRASVPPNGDGPKSEATRPRSVPPLGRRPASIPPPLPQRKGRPPMRTLTGIEPPELIESLFLSGASTEATAAGVAIDAQPKAPVENEPTRETDTEQSWNDVTNMIPRAPLVPKEAAHVPPRSGRRVPTIPPPPLPANPTPPPPDVGAKPVPHRPTLMGLAQRKASRPPPPLVRRSHHPPAAAAAPLGDTAAGTPPNAKDQEPTRAVPEAKLLGGSSAGAGRSKPPPPLHRKKPEGTSDAAATPAPSRALDAKPSTKTVPLGAPRRLAKTLEVKPETASPPDKPAPAKNETERTSEGTLVMDRPAPTAKKAPQPAPKAEAAEAKTTEPRAAEAKTAEPADASKKPLSEKTDLMIPVAKVSDEPPPRRAKTLEMAVEDHARAASASPESPAKPPSKKAKAEETTTTFQVDRSKVPAQVGAVDEELDRRSRPPRKQALEVPVSSIVAASAVWVLGLVAFFFAGRLSGFKSAGDAPVARDGIGAAFMGVVTAPDAGATTSAEPKPCWVTRQPSKWAPSASKSVPFDMRPEGDHMLVGLAQTEHEGVGLKIDPKTGKFEETFRKKIDAEIARVSPTGTPDGFFISEKGERTFVAASASSPRFLVLEKTSIGATDATDGDVKTLWPLEGDGDITAESVQRVSDDTFFLTFRRGTDVFGGYFGADKAPKGALVRVPGSEGGKVGKPRNAFNGTEVAVVFADQPKSEGDGGGWQIRIGRATSGTVPETTELVDIPEGGPGGDAIAPDVIGIKDGRWLLMWTEGPAGERAIRAQTYDRQFGPVGDPIALSPPAGSFGQAVLGVVGTYTTVAFLQAADEGFEMWGAVLQCGP
jgi:hypothetical protein